MPELNLKRVLKSGVLLSVLALSGFAAQAAHGPEGGPHGRPGGPDLMGGPHFAHLLKSVGATEAQQAQIKQIMEAARADLKPQHEQGRKLHEQGLALLSAPNIDAAAIESVRQQDQALREASSKRMSQALVDVARVLTPEQRVKIAERMKKRHDRMREHGRGGPHGSGRPGGPGAASAPAQPPAAGK